jgi:hypothetical protein
MPAAGLRRRLEEMARSSPTVPTGASVRAGDRGRADVMDTPKRGTKAEFLSRTKLVTYWVTTVFVAAEDLAGGVTDLAHGRTGVFRGTPVVAVMHQLDYPVYLLVILGFWKLGASIVLLAPGLLRAKEWAYAGAFIEYTGAVASWALRYHSLPSLGVSAIPLVIFTVASWALRPRNRILGGDLFPVQRLGIAPAARAKLQGLSSRAWR